MNSICRISAIYNEEDIIQQNLKWYSERGIPNVILDNGSTDGTYNICKELLGNEIYSLKKVPFEEHDRELSLKELSKLTRDLPFDYLLLADADEFYESPVRDEDLKVSLENEIKKGYNIVRFHNIEFWMTEKDDLSESNPLKRIRHYSFFDSNRYKLFPNNSSINFWSKFGHVPIFSKNLKFNESPKIHISRHYKFRSLAQGYAKINRIKPPVRRKDVSFHYIMFKESPENFIIPSDLLTEYFEDSNWDLERKFDGKRMNKTELMNYLGIKIEKELEKWFTSRSK